MLIDCHCHSAHSFDGHEPVERICRRAEELGIGVLAITDHCDLYPARYPLEEVKAAVCASVDETAALREKWDGSLRLLTGFELGEAVDYPDIAEEILAMREVDLVLGSIHRAGDIADFYYLDCKGENLDRINALMDDYFDRLLRLADWGKFDVLTHLTYPLRYIVGDAGIPLELGRWQDKIDALFTRIIDKGIALEVNASGLRQKIGRPLPDEPLLKRYKELGGKLISLGSDAHRYADIGSGLAACQQMLKGLGFKEVCCFVKRQPQMISL